MKLITVQKAKDEIKQLQKYVELAESYQIDNNIEKWIILGYAHTNSLEMVVKKATDLGLKTDSGDEIKKPYVTSVINSNKVNDELHRLIRLGYRQRIKPLKTRYK